MDNLLSSRFLNFLIISILNKKENWRVSCYRKLFQLTKIIIKGLRDLTELLNIGGVSNDFLIDELST